MELNETERAVLYCWINDNELTDTSGLREDDFSSQTLKCAYRASGYAEYESRLIERRNRLQAGFRGRGPVRSAPSREDSIFCFLRGKGWQLASSRYELQGIGWLPAGTCFSRLQKQGFGGAAPVNLAPSREDNICCSQQTSSVGRGWGWAGSCLPAWEGDGLASSRHVLQFQMMIKHMACSSR